MSDEQQAIAAEQNSRIDRMEVTLSHAVEAIDKIARVVNRPQETKWGPIMTALALLFAAAGGYTTLITMPMEREADRLGAQIEKLEERELERERYLGRIEGQLGINDERI